MTEQNDDEAKFKEMLRSGFGDPPPAPSFEFAKIWSGIESWQSLSRRVVRSQIALAAVASSFLIGVVVNLSPMINSNNLFVSEPNGETEILLALDEGETDEEFVPPSHLIGEELLDLSVD